MIWRFLISLVVVLATVNVAAADLVKLQTRPGVEQRFILIKPEKPVASLILFAGGKGALNLGSFLGAPSIAWGKNNFLVRTRGDFADRGFAVAVVDAPSDRQSKKGMFGGFRASQEHVEDIDAVIRYLREQANVPVWLVGTSRGTESAAHVAINSSQKPDGLVLTSSMTIPNSKGTAVTEMPLERVSIPTLVVGHTQDGCGKTPPEGANEIAGMLANASKVEVKVFSGGRNGRAKPCQAMTYHGFLGIEDEVIDYIARFIGGD